MSFAQKKLDENIMDAGMARPGSASFRVGFKEFVGLIAGLMALNALAIDAMLPALPKIGEALDIVQENQRQWIITSYTLGFGAAQLIWGTLADRYGRRPVLLISLVAYIIFSVLSALAGSFALMMAARALQGIAAAATRVLAVSIVRDRFSGRQMARVMSLSFIVFLAVPIIAPSIGQLILLFAPWPWIFGILGIWGLIVLIWAYMRLPETLHPEYRMPITPDRWLSAWRTVICERMSIGYTLAMMLLLGSLFGFVNSAQQIFYDVFDVPETFTLIFAAVAGTMAVSSFINSKIVERVGTRRVSHAALIGFILVAGLHAAVAISGHETVWTFAIFQAALMGCFGLASANFGAMAMESVGEVAGTASSLQGFISTVGGSLLGILIGQQFDGTTIPVTVGFTALGVSALLVVYVTERGKLFQPHQH